MPETFEQTDEQPSPQLTFMNSGVADVYTLLQVTEMATMEIIHRNFLRKVRKLLKALPEGSFTERAPLLERLRVLWIAHDILTDPVTRADYDLRLIGLRGGTGPGTPDDQKVSEFGGRTVLKIGELLTCAGLLEPTELEIACDMHKAMPEVQFGRFLVKQGFIQEHQLEAVLMGQKLLRKGCITVAQYQAAMDELESSGVSIAETVVERGYVTAADLQALDEAEKMESQPHLIPVYVEPVLNQDASKGSGISQLLPPAEDAAKTSTGGLASILSSIPKASEEAPAAPPKSSSMLAQILSGDHIPAIRPPTHESLTQPQIDFSLSDKPHGGNSESETLDEVVEAVLPDTTSGANEDLTETGDQEVIDSSSSTLTLEPVNIEEARAEQAPAPPSAAQTESGSETVDTAHPTRTNAENRLEQPALDAQFDSSAAGSNTNETDVPSENEQPQPPAEEESATPPARGQSTGAPPPVPNFARPYPALRDEQTTTSDRVPALTQDEQITTSDRIPALKQAPTIQLHGSPADQSGTQEPIEIVDNTDSAEDRTRELRLSDAVPSWKDQLDWSSPEQENSESEPTSEAKVSDSLPDGSAAEPAWQSQDSLQDVSMDISQETGQPEVISQIEVEAREINLANAVPAWKDQLDWDSPEDMPADRQSSSNDEGHRDKQETLELEPVVAEPEAAIEIREIRLSDAVPSWKDQLDWDAPEGSAGTPEHDLHDTDSIERPELTELDDSRTTESKDGSSEGEDGQQSAFAADSDRTFGEGEFDASPDSDSSEVGSPHTVPAATIESNQPAAPVIRRSDTGPLPAIAADERLTPPAAQEAEMSVLEQIEDTIMEFLTVDFSEDEAAEQAKALQAQTSEDKLIGSERERDRKSSGEFVFQIDADPGVNIYTREDLAQHDEHSAGEKDTTASSEEKLFDDEHATEQDTQSKKSMNKHDKNKSKKRKTR